VEIVAIAVVVLVLLWLAVTIYQVVIFALRLVEAARTRDYERYGQAVRRRTSELLWTIPAGAVLSILLGFGIDLSSRVFENNDLTIGFYVLVATFLVGAFGGLGIVWFIIRKERPDYASIRADLVELAGERLTVERIEQFRALLKDADVRQRRIRIGRRNRAGVAGARAELEDISQSFKERSPIGNQAVRSIPWSVAVEVFWRASFIGIIAVLVSVASWVILVVVGVQSGNWSALPLLLSLVVSTLVSVALGIAGTRAALAARTAQHAVYLKQRAEIVDLLEEFDRTARKGVAGLGDRVARALQILRDQQG